MVGRLARAELRGADRRDLRNRRDGLLLQRRSRRARAASSSLVRDPATTLIAIGILFAARSSGCVRRTTWRPGVPLRLARRRAWGRILSGAGADVRSRRAGLFVGIGVLFIPLGIADLARAGARPRRLRRCSASTRPGEGAGALVLLVVALGTTLALLGFALVQAATARALVEIDAGRPIGPVHAYRLALDSVPSSARRAAARGRGLGCADRDRVPDPNRALARRALGVSRAGRGARGRLGARRPAPKRPSSSAGAGSASPRSSGSASCSRSRSGRSSGPC